MSVTLRIQLAGILVSARARLIAGSDRTATIARATRSSKFRPMIFHLALPTGVLALAVALPLCGARAQSGAPDTRASANASTNASTNAATNAATGLAPIGVLDPTSSLTREAQNSDAMNPAAVVALPSLPSDLPKPFAAFSATARSLGDSLVAFTLP